MKISSRSEYAIKAMIELAINEHDNPVSLADISKANGISISYLEQLFSKLRSHKLIDGIRGPGGGYRLGKPASRITIAQVLDAIENDDVEAVETDGPVNADAPAPQHQLWQSLSEQVHGFLDGIKLIDLLDNADIRRSPMIKDTTTQYIASMFKPTSRHVHCPV